LEVFDQLKGQPLKTNGIGMLPNQSIEQAQQMLSQKAPEAVTFYLPALLDEGILAIRERILGQYYAANPHEQLVIQPYRPHVTVAFWISDRFDGDKVEHPMLSRMITPPQALSYGALSYQLQMRDGDGTPIFYNPSEASGQSSTQQLPGYVPKCHAEYFDV
jgi:hypothetical protein